MNCRRRALSPSARHSASETVRRARARSSWARSREIELAAEVREEKSGARSGFSLRARLVRSATKRARLTGGIPNDCRAPWDLVKTKLAFRHVLRQRVASVASLQRLQGKTKKDLKKKIEQGMAAHGWTSSSVFKTPRKKGGHEEWVATEPVLQQMYEEF